MNKRLSVTLCLGVVAASVSAPQSFCNAVSSHPRSTRKSQPPSLWPHSIGKSKMPRCSNSPTTTRTHTNDGDEAIIFASLLENEGFKKNGSARDDCIQNAVETLRSSPATHSSAKDSLGPATAYPGSTKCLRCRCHMNSISASYSTPPSMLQVVVLLS